MRYLHTMLRVRDLDAALIFIATNSASRKSAGGPTTKIATLSLLAGPDDAGRGQQAAGRGAAAGADL